MTSSRSGRPRMKLSARAVNTTSPPALSMAAARRLDARDRERRGRKAAWRFGQILDRQTRNAGRDAAA